MYYSFKGNLALGRSYLEQSLSEAEKASDLDILGPPAYGLFANCILEGNCIRIANIAPRIIRLVEETHREYEDFGTPANLYATLQSQCGSTKALEYIEKALKMQVASGLPYWLSFHHVGLSIVHLELNDLTKALFHAEEAINYAKKNKERHWEALSLWQLGMVGWKSQKIKIDEAEQHIRQGIRIVNELEMKPFEMVGYLYLGELFADANEREKALEILKNHKERYLHQVYGLIWDWPTISSATFRRHWST